MSLVQKEITELREMLKQVDEGGIKMEAVRAKLQIYKESHKRVKLYVDLYIACGNKDNAEAFKALISKNDVIGLPE